MTDAVAILRRLLLDDAGVTDLVANRVYASEIPATIIKPTEAQTMPMKLVIVAAAGGQDKRDSSLVIRPRLLVWSCGESYHEAGRVDRAVFEVLDALQRRIVDGVLAHSALTGYPTTVKDAETGWPGQQRTVTLILSEEEV